MEREFLGRYLKRIVVKICVIIGWKKIGREALNVLTDLLHNYLRSFCKSLKIPVENSNRLELNLTDLIFAFRYYNFNLNEISDYFTHFPSDSLYMKFPTITRNKDLLTIPLISENLLSPTRRDYPLNIERMLEVKKNTCQISDEAKNNGLSSSTTENDVPQLFPPPGSLSESNKISDNTSDNVLSSPRPEKDVGVIETGVLQLSLYPGSSVPDSSGNQTNFVSDNVRNDRSPSLQLEKDVEMNKIRVLPTPGSSLQDISENQLNQTSGNALNNQSSSPVPEKDVEISKTSVLQLLPSPGSPLRDRSGNQNAKNNKSPSLRLEKDMELVKTNEIGVFPTPGSSLQDISENQLNQTSGNALNNQSSAPVPEKDVEISKTTVLQLLTSPGSPLRDRSANQNAKNNKSPLLRLEEDVLEMESTKTNENEILSFPILGSLRQDSLKNKFNAGNTVSSPPVLEKDVAPNVESIKTNKIGVSPGSRLRDSSENQRSLPRSSTQVSLESVNARNNVSSFLSSPKKDVPNVEPKKMNETVVFKFSPSPGSSLPDDSCENQRSISSVLGEDVASDVELIKVNEHCVLIVQTPRSPPQSCSGNRFQQTSTNVTCSSGPEKCVASSVKLTKMIENGVLRLTLSPENPPQMAKNKFKRNLEENPNFGIPSTSKTFGGNNQESFPITHNSKIIKNFRDNKENFKKSTKKSVKVAVTKQSEQKKCAQWKNSGQKKLLKRCSEKKKIPKMPIFKIVSNEDLKILLARVQHSSNSSKDQVIELDSTRKRKITNDLPGPSPKKRGVE